MDFTIQHQMHKFRRAIAIFMLTLFSCQSIWAAVGEHAISAHGDGASTQHSHDSAAPGALDSSHGDSGALSALDGDCCHAHGHCHLLAFTGQAVQVSIPYWHGIASSATPVYFSLSINPLLRPPATV